MTQKIAGSTRNNSGFVTLHNHTPIPLPLSLNVFLENSLRVVILKIKTKERALTSHKTKHDKTSRIHGMGIGVEWSHRIHGCQMAIARFLDRIHLALQCSGLWLRFATLQNLITLSF